MPKYLFDASGVNRSKLIRQDAELPDIEAARNFAIGLAETVLRSHDGDGENRSYIAIRDENGEELEQVLSVAD